MLMSILLRSVTELCPVYSPFFGSMGITASIVFTVFGGAYGTAKSSVGISSVGVMKPEFIMKSVIPVIFAGIIGLYGLIVCILLFINVTKSEYSLNRAFLDLGSGLTCGLCGLASGMAIGISGDCGVRGAAQQPKLFVGMLICQIFSEALALYGFIVALIMASTGDNSCVATASSSSSA
ncbi:V-type ATPase, C subunit protein [Entamoeba nuttalli P19]|uniref:V-type proton ATPase proteolipid subunit n=2 Tax=Entamoeba nuttalli TaxID=412467 RepID=K2GY58_ENTNP|nr:V-type ATPase, C subunit protein [Entamoeba nuttalli P19]EKE40168.1 V-type ATPase, C subunit protein [Entamoeba nuttalli P19]|eukprot:XP_008857500.1 V-type ATPase, C subunit protein [Entamoeba nuttalli P19]